jgi:hypothetical protein
VDAPVEVVDQNVDLVVAKILQGIRHLSILELSKNLHNGGNILGLKFWNGKNSEIRTTRTWGPREDRRKKLSVVSAVRWATFLVETIKRKIANYKIVSANLEAYRAHMH